jgi:hypothetical protein
MLLFRALLFLMLVGAGVCFAFFIATNNLRFRRWGMQLLQYTLLTALVFFGVLILSRILERQCRCPAQRLGRRL